MKKWIFLLALGAGCLPTIIHAQASWPEPVAGQWQMTESVDANGGHIGGAQSHQSTYCYDGRGIQKLLMQKPGQKCGPWQLDDKGNSNLTLEGPCHMDAPPPVGNMVMHVSAKVHVAPDGRSMEGTVQSASEFNGMTLTSPVIQFEAHYVGTCAVH